jgi:hypothetical protein
LEEAMAGWEMKIITAEAQRLMAMAAEDADLRAGLRDLAETILAATADTPPHPAMTACLPADLAPMVSPSGAVPVPIAGGDEPDTPKTPSVARDDPPQVKEPLKGRRSRPNVASASPVQ